MTKLANEGLPERNQPEEADSIVLAKIPNLLDSIEENHLQVAPYKDDKGNVTAYDVKSRGGHQLFRVSADDMAFAVVKDTILNAAADKEEVTGAFDVMENVQRSLHRLGIADKDIPRTPHDIAEQVISLMNDFERIQQAKSKIDLQNNFQAFLAMSQRVFAGGKPEWNKLAPAQQRWMLVFGDTLLVRALQELGVGQETKATSETVMQIAENLSSMRREAAWYTGAGQALKGLADGTTQLIFGGKDIKGLIPGTIQATGNLVGGALNGAGDLIARGVDGARRRSRKKDDNVVDGHEV